MITHPAHIYLKLIKTATLKNLTPKRKHISQMSLSLSLEKLNLIRLGSDALLINWMCVDGIYWVQQWAQLTVRPEFNARTMVWVCVCVRNGKTQCVSLMKAVTERWTGPWLCIHFYSGAIGGFSRCMWVSVCVSVICYMDRERKRLPVQWPRGTAQGHTPTLWAISTETETYRTSLILLSISLYTFVLCYLLVLRL